MEVNENSVLVFCSSAMGLRENIRKSLAMVNFQVSFASSIDEVNKLVAKLQPKFFVHDWGAVEDSQARAFQLRIDKLDSYANIIRVLLVEQVDVGMQAFASDANIDRVISYSNAINLGQNLSMGQMSGISDLQKFVRKMKSSVKNYDQKHIDQKVEEAYQQFPHDEKVAVEYANLTYRQGDYLDTCKLAKGILQKNQSNLRAANVYSRALMKLNKFDEAQKVLQQSNSLSPDSPERLVMLGEAFHGNGDLENALNFYERAHEIDESSTDAIKGIGTIKIDQGKTEELIDLFRGSMSEDEAASFFNNSAVSAVKQGKMNQAIKLYESAMKSLFTDTYKPVILTNMAITCMRIEDYNKASRCIRLALKIDPNHKKALRQKIFLEKKAA